MSPHLIVSVIEIVGNVQAQCPEFPALQQHRVEVGQREQQLCVLNVLLALIEALIADGVEQP